MQILKLLTKGWSIIRYRLVQQGLCVTAWWAADHLVRRITGAPIRRVSQITPQLHVGGQYKKRGWPRLAARGITAVVNMRIEFDDRKAGIAPERYLYLPTVDDDAPSLEQLHEGMVFIRQETAAGGSVYVHCGAGVGRAATMAVAYLIGAGLPPAEAWTAIRRVRPFVRPSRVQLEQIEQFAKTWRVC